MSTPSSAENDDDDVVDVVVVQFGSTVDDHDDRNDGSRIPSRSISAASYA